MPDNQSLFPIEGLLGFKRDTYENTLSNKIPLAGLLTDMWEKGKLPFVPSPRGLPSSGLLYMMAIDEDDQGGYLPEPEEGTIRLYNAGLRERDPEGFLEPNISDWVKEVAEGTGLPPEEITKELIYMSDDQTNWTPMIVARNLGKRVEEVTDEDIRKYGRLNVLDIPKDAPVYQVGDYSSTGKVRNLEGQEMYFGETDLYDEGDIFSGEGRMTEMPVGPEPKDFISSEAQEITYTLLGDELVNFLKKMRN